jgi:hypothetical protein
MKSCVVRVFGPGWQKTSCRGVAVADRIVRDRRITPRILNGRLAVHAELRQLTADHAEEPDVVEIPVLHEVVEPVGAHRRPVAMDFQHDRPLLVLNAARNVFGACSVSDDGLRKPPASWAPIRPQAAATTNSAASAV